MSVYRDIRVPARPKPSPSTDGGAGSIGQGTGGTNPFAGLRSEFEKPIGPQLTADDLDALYRRLYGLSSGQRSSAALSAVQRAGGDVSSPYYAQQAGGLAAGAASDSARALADVKLQDLFNQQNLEEQRRQMLFSLAGAEGSYGLGERGQALNERQQGFGERQYAQSRLDTTTQRQLAQLQAMIQMQELQGQQGGFVNLWDRNHPTYVGSPQYAGASGGGEPGFGDPGGSLISPAGQLDFLNRLYPPLQSARPVPRSGPQPGQPPGTTNDENASYAPSENGSFATSKSTPAKKKRPTLGL